MDLNMILTFMPLLLAILLYYKYRRQITYELNYPDFFITSRNCSIKMKAERQTRKRPKSLPAKSISIPLNENQKQTQTCFQRQLISKIPVKNPSPSTKGENENGLYRHQQQLNSKIPVIMTSLSTKGENNVGLPRHPQLDKVLTDIVQPNSLEVPAGSHVLPQSSKTEIFKRDSSTECSFFTHPEAVRTVSHAFTQTENILRTEVTETSSSSVNTEASSIVNSNSEAKRPPKYKPPVCIAHSPVLDISHLTKEYIAMKKKQEKKKRK